MRISTAYTYANALNNLQQARQRQIDANTQVSTQKIATDLMGFGRTSEVIASCQAALTKTQGYVDVNGTVSDRLSNQDLALGTISQAATDAKSSVMSALTTGDGTSLMLSLEGNFDTALNGLNYQHNGQYLFGGGNDSNTPIKVTSLSALGALPAGGAAQAFGNGSIKKTSRINANSTLQTGILASDLGQKMMQTFQDIKQFNDTNADGPFGAKMTTAQKDFLTTKTKEFSDEYNQLVQQRAVNGTMQKRVDNTTTSLRGQVSLLQTLIGGKTDADMATAYSTLQQANVAVQASAQVLSNLNQYSLLNLLK